jgi:hypothetical protein
VFPFERRSFPAQRVLRGKVGRGAEPTGTAAEVVERVRFVYHVRAGFKGTPAGLPGVTYVQVRRATAVSNDAVWVQVDGELLGRPR